MSKRVLIIDDDMVYQLIMKKMMEKVSADVTIETCQNGALGLEALARCGDALPDVIFLDINMPVMDGWQVLAGIAQHYPALPQTTRIYMISTSLDARDKERALSHPEVREYIYKPISADKIREVLEG